MAAAAVLPVRRLEPPAATAQRRHPHVKGDSPAPSGGGARGEKGGVVCGERVLGAGRQGGGVLRGGGGRTVVKPTARAG